jgi:hypothetical protein
MVVEGAVSAKEERTVQSVRRLGKGFPGGERPTMRSCA